MSSLLLAWSLASTSAWAGTCAQLQGEQLVLQDATVYFDGAELKSTAPVDQIVCALQADSHLRVQVEVYTDSQGSGAYNLSVSQARADAIMAALLAADITADRVTAVGYGELYPVSTNASQEGRRQNRRVEWHTALPSERPPAPEAKSSAPLPPRPMPVRVLTEVDRLCEAMGSPSDLDLTLNDTPTHLAKGVRSNCKGYWSLIEDGPDVYGMVPGWTVSLRAVGAQTQVRITAQ